MAEAKPFASLSSGLLARKGAARPAMRPQGFGQVGHSLEDLGWNDMGFEPPKPSDAPRDEDHDAFGDDVVEHPRAHLTGLTPVGSPGHNQQAELADRLGGGETDEEELDETAEPYQSEAEAASPPTPTPEPELDPEFEAELEPEPELEHEPAFEPDPEFEPVLVSAPATPPARRPVLITAPEAPPAPQPALVVSPARPPRRAPRPRAAPGSKGKAAFTLRLDPDRHLKLRLACAVGGRSAQQLVTDALDQLLEHMPELDAMAAKAKRKG